jgi:hypothetical protein
MMYGHILIWKVRLNRMNQILHMLGELSYGHKANNTISF